MFLKLFLWDYFGKVAETAVFLHCHRHPYQVVNISSFEDDATRKLVALNVSDIFRFLIAPCCKISVGMPQSATDRKA